MTNAQRVFSNLFIAPTICIVAAACDAPPPDGPTSLANQGEVVSLAKSDFVEAPMPTQWYSDIKVCDAKLLRNESERAEVIELLGLVGRATTSQSELEAILGAPEIVSETTGWNTSSGSYRATYSVDYPSRGLYFLLINNPIQIVSVTIRTCDVAVERFRVGDSIEEVLESLRSEQPRWEGGEPNVEWTTTQDEDTWWFRGRGLRIGVERDKSKPKFPMARAEPEVVSALEVTNIDIAFRGRRP